MKHFSDIFFWSAIILWLFIRPWPYGDTLHTIADITLSLAALATLLQYWHKYKAKSR